MAGNPAQLSVEGIAEAARLIDPVFRDSPQFRAESLEPSLGCRLVVKVETLNPIRSFKGRGTEYLSATLAGRPHLVCATAGNFGQGMAWSARRRGLTVSIFASLHANPRKVERMRALGGDVRLVGEDTDQAFQAAEAFARESGGRLVVDGRDHAISQGAGTIGIELLRWPEAFDDILIPVGDGALLAGVAAWVKTHRPATRMIGVCARGAPAMERSWRAGRVVEHEAATIADGMAVGSPFPEALEQLAGRVDDFLLVEDEVLLTAMQHAHQELGLVLEPSGAAGLAALLAHRQRFEGRRVATILTGGNLTAEQARQWLCV